MQMQYLHIKYNDNSNNIKTLLIILTQKGLCEFIETWFLFFLISQGFLQEHRYSKGRHTVQSKQKKKK